MMTLIAILFLSYLNEYPAQQVQQNIKDEILGEWIWTKSTTSSRGGDHTVETPESCACTRSIIINDDGTIQYFENGEFVEQEIYRLDSIVMEGSPTRNRFRSASIYGTIELLPDQSMGIGAFGICGTIHYYHRRKSQ